MALIEIHVHSDDAKLDKIMKLIKQIGEKMVTQDDIDVLTQQAEKIHAEVAEAADKLRQQIAELQAAGVNLDISKLKQALQIMDDINPDAPEEGGDGEERDEEEEEDEE